MIDLPLEKLADAVAALRNEVWGNPEHERRALPRIRIWAPRVIRLLDPAAADPDAAAGAPQDAAAEDLEVWLVDLACGGIGFLSPRPLDVGRPFLLTLPVMDAAPVNLFCRILHCQPAPNGSFVVGGRFIKELATPEPAADPAAAAAPEAASLRHAI
jgi:hypothetical protein